MESISVHNLKQLLDQGEPVKLLDVRDPWEFELCRIQGSINVPMSDVTSVLDSLDQADHTVVICHHGMRSLQVAGLLESMGFQRVFNLEGGLDAWATTVDTGMPRY